MAGRISSRFDWSLLLGYDIFISYKRGAAASVYSRNLRNALSDVGFKCFLDQEQTEGGVELTPALRKALRRTRLLVVLVEPNVVRSEYVPGEIGTFRARRRGRIVPINVGSFLQAGKPQPAPFDYLQTLTWLDEAERSFESGSPSEPIVSGIRTSFGRLRVAAISRAITWAALLILTTAAIVALLQRQSALREAELSLAQAYSSDLNLAELAHDRRDTPAVLEFLTRYADRPDGGRIPEFGWRHLWGQYTGERRRLTHDAAASWVALSPDGSTMVTTTAPSGANKGAVARVWDMPAGTLRHKIDLSVYTNAGPVAFAPDGRRFAAVVQDYGRDEQQIIVWESRTGNELRTIVATGAGGGLAFTRDGRSIVAPCARGLNAPFQIWDVETGAARFTNQMPEGLEKISAWAYAPDGRTVAVAFAETFVKGVFLPPHIGVWDTDTRSLRADFTKGDSLRGTLQAVGGLAYSPDSSVLAAAVGTAMSATGYTVSPDGRVWLWALDSAMPLAVLRDHRAGTHSVAYSRDGAWLATASGAPDISSPGKDSELIIRDARSLKAHATVTQAQTGFVSQLVFSPANSMLAVVAADAIVTLVDAESGQVLQELRGHSAPITSVVFTNDGRGLVTASSDGSTRIWATDRPRDAMSFGEPSEEISATAVSRDGNIMALGLRSARVVLDDVSRPGVARRLLPAPAAVEQLAFSGDGRRLVGHTGTDLLVWNLETGTLWRQFAAAEGVVHALGVDEAGQLVTAAVGGTSASSVAIERWDVEGSRQVARRPLGGFDEFLAMSDDGNAIVVRRDLEAIEIHDVLTGALRFRSRSDKGAETSVAALSRDGARIAIAESGRFSRPRGVRVLDTRTRATIAELPARAEGIHTLAFDASGRVLVSSGYATAMVSLSPRAELAQTMGRVRIWDVERATERASASVTSANINAVTRRLQSRLHVLGDGGAIAVKERGGLVRIDAHTGHITAASRPEPADVHSVAITGDARTFVTTMRPGEEGMGDIVKIFDARQPATPLVLPDLPPAEAWSIAFSSDGRMLAVGSEGGTIRLYDTGTAAVIAVLEGHRGSARSLAFSADGRTLTASTADADVRQEWDLATGRQVRASDGARANVEADRASEIASAVSFDGKTIAVVVGSAPDSIAIRERSSGKELTRLRTDTDVRALAFSRDGLVAAGYASGRIRIWQLPGTQPTATLPDRDRADGMPLPPVLALAFDPVAARLAAGHADGMIAVWEKSDRWRPTEVTGHVREVRVLGFSPGGTTLASGDAQGRLVLWNVPSSQQPEMHVVLRRDRRLAVAGASPDGKTIITGGHDKAVMLWDAATAAPQAMLLGHTAPVTALSFSASGRWLSTASSAEVITWDVAERRRLSTVQGSAPIQLSADGEWLVTTIDQDTVQVWRARSGSSEKVIGGLGELARALALSADGQTLAIASESRATLWNARTGAALSGLSGFRGGRFGAATVSPDGHTLATAGEGRVDLWLAMTGRRLLTLGAIDGEVVDLRFATDGTQLIAATKNGIRRWPAPRPASGIAAAEAVKESPLFSASIHAATRAER